MWMPAHTTTPPGAHARSAATTSSPAGAKMIAASSGSGAGPVESPAHSAPSDSASSRAPGVAGAHEREHAPALVRRDLADDVRRRAEAVQPEPRAVARHPQRPEADQPAAQQRRDLEIAQRVGQIEHEPLVGHGVLGVAAVDVLAGEPAGHAQVLAAGAAVRARPVRPAEPWHADAPPVHRADDLVAQDQRQMAGRDLAVAQVQVGPADAAGARPGSAPGRGPGRAPGPPRAAEGGPARRAAARAPDQPLTRLRQEVERVGQLERHLRVAAGEVRVLVADVGDDLVALLLDPRAGGALVDDRRVRRGVRLEDQLLVAGEALAREVARGVRAGVLAPAGDQEDREAARLGVVEELLRRRDGGADLVRGLGLRGRAEREVVGVDRRVVRQQRLVDVEDDRRLLAVVVVAVAVTVVAAVARASGPPPPCGPRSAPSGRCSAGRRRRPAGSGCRRCGRGRRDRRGACSPSRPRCTTSRSPGTAVRRRRRRARPWGRGRSR